MADDAYTYVLLAKFDDNKIPKLRNKLVKYFQSKKQSNGGDCLVECDDLHRTAVLRFRTEEDRHKVVGKDAHEIRLDHGVLKITVRIPDGDESSPKQKAPTDDTNKTSDAAVQKKQIHEGRPIPVAEHQSQADSRDDQRDDEEELCSTSAVIGNIPQDVDQEVLEMLVENILKHSESSATSQIFSLEILPDKSSAVVTFQSGKENTDFITNCPRNKTFKKKALSVCPLEVTAKVITEDIPDVSSDLLILYFEKEGVEVEDVTLNEEERFAIITFKTPKAVSKVIEKKLLIKQQPVKVFPFYDSLGTALYGKDRPTLKLPAAFSESIDQSIWRNHNNHNKAAETFHSDLAKHYCKADLQEHASVCLRPLPSLGSRCNMSDCKPSIEDLDSSLCLDEAMASQLNVQLDGDSIRIVKNYGSNLRDIVQSKFGCNAEFCGVDSSMNPGNRKPTIVCEKKFSVELHKGLKVSVWKADLTSFPVDAVVNAANEHLKHFGGLALALSIAGGPEFQRESDNYIHQRGKLQTGEAVVTNAGGALQCRKIIHAVGPSLPLNPTPAMVSRVEPKLEKAVMSILDQVEMHALQSVAIPALSSGLFNFPLSRCADVIVSALKEYHDKKYQQKYSLREIHLVNHDDPSVREMQRACQTLAYTTKSYSHAAGSRLLFDEELLLFDTLTVSEPGVKKFFQEKETMYVASVMNETGCLVQMVDGADGGQDLSPGQVPNPTYQVETTDGVEIAVCKADMCSYPVSAVINSSNQDLKHIGGLSGALLDAAGPQLQDECDRLITQKGQLKPGDCVMTGAGGRLMCKNIIHTVGPGFDQAYRDRAVGQLRRAIKKSLELAKECGCTSVALPAISLNSGFPLNLCSDTIVKAVKEYCQDMYGDNTLKKIHLVNKDDNTVQAMETAVRKEFGNHGVSHSQQKHPSTPTKTLGALSLSHSQQKHPSTPTKSPCVLRVQSTSNSDQVVTNEGLIIMLTKGNIQDATTDVVVNTTGEDLALDRGAVSKAILGAAGHNLQTLVHEQKSTGKVGDVIVTNGCNLKCTKVFHAVTPYWDNGHGTAEKMLKGILKDCLSQTESSGLTSITFPAIGTGNRGFPKDRVASLLLNEVIKFSSSKQPKHLKTIVIILHPSDASTVQAFNDEFKRIFTHSGSSQPTTHSTGPFSKIISSSGMHETKMGRVDIQVVTGDITKEATDVIVNSSNESFTLKSGVSKAILKAAGQIVEDKCKELGAQGKQGMIMTQPGNLKCKTILHLVVQSAPVKINKAVKDALQMCMKYSYTSISFPALGTGKGNIQATEVADAMLDAVVDVLSQSSQNSLKTIRIVIFQSQMLKEFHISMNKKEGTDQKDKGTHQKNRGSSSRSWSNISYY